MMMILAVNGIPCIISHVLTKSVLQMTLAKKTSLFTDANRIALLNVRIQCQAG